MAKLRAEDDVVRLRQLLDCAVYLLARHLHVKLDTAADLVEVERRERTQRGEWSG